MKGGQEAFSGIVRRRHGEEREGDRKCSSGRREDEEGVLELR